MKSSKHKSSGKSAGLDLYQKAKDIAEYYGFMPLSEIENLMNRSRPGEKKGKSFEFKAPKEDTAGDADRPSIMKAYVEQGMHTLPSPILIHHSEPLLRQMDRKAYGGKDAVQFSLEIIGTNKSVAEAMLLKTAVIILREAGFENISIVVNNLGDRESIARFTREFGNYYKKHLDEVPASCRALLKKDIFKLLECVYEKCDLFKEHAPKPIACLSEESRQHFKEVLEFLESMNTPYTINNCLVGGKDYYTKTVFEIVASGEEKGVVGTLATGVIARGGRYDDLAKRYGSKKEVPAVGISITMGGIGLAEPKETKKTGKKPSVYLMQLGFDAKLKSLEAVEYLRRGKIPVFQSLSKDKISIQIAQAEKMGIPFVIIIGQKEALEGTAIVRNMKNRSQESIKMPELAAYIRKTV
jgi:histidyl-tRNA synthetase